MASRVLTRSQRPLHGPAARQVLILREARVLVGLEVLLGSHALHQLAHGSPLPPILGTEHSRPTARYVPCPVLRLRTLPGNPGSQAAGAPATRAAGVQPAPPRRPEGGHHGPVSQMAMTARGEPAPADTSGSEHEQPGRGLDGVWAACPHLGGPTGTSLSGTASLTSFFTSFPLALALLLLAVAGGLVWEARASGGRAATRGGGSAAPEPASFPFFFWVRKQQRCHQRPSSPTTRPPGRGTRHLPSLSASMSVLHLNCFITTICCLL